MLATYRLAFGVSAQSVELSTRHFGTVVTDRFVWSGGTDTNIGPVDPTDPEVGEFQEGSRLQQTIEALGVGLLRYPGGTEAWSTFDWRTKDQEPEQFGLTDRQKLEAAVAFSARYDLPFSFTFPVRNVAENGIVPKASVQDFFVDFFIPLAQRYEIDLASIKVGNEYNVGQRGGHPISAVEYGEVASELTRIIGQSLDLYFDRYDQARPEVLIEPGVLWRYGYADIAVLDPSTGVRSRNGVQDVVDIQREFDQIELSYLDGLDLHSLTLGTTFEMFAGDGDTAGHPWLSQQELLVRVSQQWSDFTLEQQLPHELSLHTLAWSLPRSIDWSEQSSNFALPIFHLYLSSLVGLQSAMAWTAISFSPNSLVDPGPPGANLPEVAVTPAGQVFEMLSTTLKGYEAFDAGVGSTAADPIQIAGFHTENELRIFVLNTGSGTLSVRLDLSDILREHAYVDASYIGIVQRWFFDQSDQLVAAPLENLDTNELFGSTELLNLQLSPLGLVEVALKVGNQDYKPGITIADQGRLQGTVGSDYLLGSSRADFLDGGAAPDTMEGAGGDDVYIVDNFEDIVVERLGYAAGGGIDTVRAFIDYVQPHNVEVVRLGFSDQAYDLSAYGTWAPGVLVGNAGANSLFGGGGNDRLVGHSGQDVLVGGLGKDTLVGGPGADTFVFGSVADSWATETKRDVINGFEMGLDKIDITKLTNADAGTDHMRLSYLGRDQFEFRDQDTVQLRVQSVSRTDAHLIEIDIDGDAQQDMQVLVLGQSGLSETDFIF